MKPNDSKNEFSPFPEESVNAKQNMEDALAFRNSEGLIYPIVPTGDGDLLRSMGTVRAPVWEPGEDGLTDPIIWSDVFAHGRIPKNLRYETGHMAIDNRTGQPKVFFDNPLWNLPPHQRLQLQRPDLLPPPPTPPNPQDIPGVPSLRTVIATPQGMVMQSGDVREALSNFSVRPLERRLVKQQSKVDVEEFLLDIECGGEHRVLTIVSKDLENVVPSIVRFFPACHTDADASKASARIANSVRDQIPTLPTVTVVKSPGFIRLNGQWVYAHDGAIFNGPVEFRTGCTIPCDPQVSREKALHALLGVLELTVNSPTMLPLLLVSHLGPLYNLFEAAGFAPQFVLFLHGQTGSLKTAVVQALFRLFKELPKTPEATFRDTKTALEVKIGAACSRVLPIDDYKPAVTSATGREDEDKLEHIIRMFGDGIAKARSNSELGRAKEFHPAGCCVVTGEDTGGSHSSLLRCLVLSVQKGEINGEKLRFFQENPVVLQTHFYHFLKWAGVYGEEIVDFIQREFQEERQFFSEIVKEPRQADIGATMMLTAQILLGYVQEVMMLNVSEIFDVKQRWANTLVEVLRRSEEETVELDPIQMYLEALFDGQAAGRINIAPTQVEFKRGQHLGFAKDGVWWLFPKEIYAYVKQHWKAQGVIFPLKAEKVHALLYQKQLLDVNRENRKGREKVLYTKKSTLEPRSRMLVLRIEQAREYLENGGK